MRYSIFLLQIICFLLFTNVVKAQEKDIISVYKTEMEKEKIFVKEIEKSITSDTLFYPFGKESILTSLTVSGNLKSFSKKSFLRITLIDSDGVEYLVFESNYMTRDSPDFHFQEEFEETGVLDYITPVCVFIKITSSELNNLKVNYTERLEDKDKKIRNIKLDIIKFRKEQKISKINDRIATLNQKWIAGETSVSKLSYNEKKKLFGDQIPNLIGFEYYKGGFFEVIEDKKPTTVRLRTTSQIVSDFDWRNRHGKDWTTAAQQQNGGTCWAYATIGAVEALVNLYFNNENIDLDLSEQDIIACSGGGDCNNGGTPHGTFDYLTYSGVVDEFCFRDNDCSQSCSRKCPNPSERIRIGGGGSTNYGSEDTETEIKKMIISKGVLCGSMLSWNHYMALAGFGTVRIGDEIRTDTTGIYIVRTIAAGDSLIGKTYWIFKNSWGSWGIDGTGYCYVVTNSSELLATTVLETPLVRANHTNTEIISEDKDGDGYYNWGIGNRPISCPQCALTEKDGDDSDPYFGPMDAYGNLQPAMPNYTYPPTIINSYRTYYADVRLCGDLIVESNATLDIVGTLHFPPNSQIIVNNGGKIVVKDNGIIKNANLIVHPGGSLILQSNAVLEMGLNDEINIEVGATFDFINGEINKNN